MRARSSPLRSASAMLPLRMYDWVNGRPTILLRGKDLSGWPGAALEPDAASWAAVRTFAGGQALVLRDPELTTAVPLELGGLMLVTAVYCDADSVVTAQLDALPVAGWDMLPERFIADGGDYVLFDGSLSGAQIADPQLEQVIAEQHGGVIPVQLPPGSYEVEVLGPFRPDTRTELWLTRLVRAGS
jgi:hypothetical protein